MHWIGKATPNLSDDYYAEGADGHVYQVSMSGATRTGPKFVPPLQSSEYVGGRPILPIAIRVNRVVPLIKYHGTNVERRDIMPITVEPCYGRRIHPDVPKLPSTLAYGTTMSEANITTLTIRSKKKEEPSSNKPSTSKGKQKVTWQKKDSTTESGTSESSEEAKMEKRNAYQRRYLRFDTKGAKGNAISGSTNGRFHFTQQGPESQSEVISGNPKLGEASKFDKFGSRIAFHGPEDEQGYKVLIGRPWFYGVGVTEDWNRQEIFFQVEGCQNKLLFGGLQSLEKDLLAYSEEIKALYISGLEAYASEAEAIEFRGATIYNLNKIEERSSPKGTIVEGSLADTTKKATLPTIANILPSYPSCWTAGTTRSDWKIESKTIVEGTMRTIFPCSVPKEIEGDSSRKKGKTAKDYGKRSNRNNTEQL
ncbi:hypothetical protein R1flu_008966 [Riccia fluitans]|uniref:Uncharacterized protein n=1 Tax=Riccia fluitans TaxID=41844 RepID=A0ABD1Z1W9_9MARC